ncbi:MAG: hypothetical protein EZS28_048242, partial [Streblomastix strix]
PNTIIQPESTNTKLKEILSNFTLEFFEKEISLLKSGSSPGPSGWSVDVLKMLVATNKPFLAVLFDFFIAMLRAQFFPTSFFCGSAIGLLEPGKDNPRPICIPETFNKLFSRIILDLEQNTYQAIIPETQMGVRKAWGGERIVSILQNSIDFQNMAAKNGNTDLYIIQTHISGAFNNVVRQQLIDILGNAGASDLLLSYLSQFFTKKQQYHFANGTAMPINSTVGIPQGDPMSPANFSVVTAELINALNQTKAENFNNKNELKTIYNSSEWLPAVFGYMDDLFITASSKHEAIQLFELAEHHLHQLEMNFNYRKCKALWIHNGKISQGQPIHTQGGDISLNEYLKVFGVPITQSQFIRDREFDAVVNEMCRAADVATLLFSQNALML